MFMSKEELDSNMSILNVGDHVAIVRKSLANKNRYDYMSGTIESVTKGTLILSFETLSNKRVLKNSIVSLKIKQKATEL